MASKAPSIKAIDKTSVHRICSGQVVLSLSIAVKELVENSLDAGSTVVDIKLKEYGSEQVEVSDNGSGVHPDNFEGLTLKHHTSKLQEFSDIFALNTFGFRGEALSSLCALCDLSVITRHESQACGTSMVFDHNGHIKERKAVPRQVGTTVVLGNLFSTLPVRHKEFQRNLKKEFAKMTQLLNAYCLVSTGVKITCTNQTKSGSRTTFVSTQGCKTVKENIASVFGAKQLSTLLDIKEKPPPQEVLEELKADLEAVNLFRMEGCISTCAHKEGRSSKDRQFFYINSRPCEPEKIIKIVNEVYHQFNRHQYPFVYLNISMEKDAVDVNVTPDKRKIFLNHEKLLLAVLKASLLALYEKIPSTYEVSNISLTTFSPPAVSEKLTTLSRLSQFKHKSDSKRELETTENSASVKRQKQNSLQQSRLSFAHEKVTPKVEKIEDVPSPVQILEPKSSESLNHLIEDERMECDPEQSDDSTAKPSDEIHTEVIEDDEVPHAEEEEKAFTLEIIEPPGQTIKDLESKTTSDKRESQVKVVIHDEPKTEGDSQKRILDISLDSLKVALENRKKVHKEQEEIKIKFRAHIDPSKNSQAEEELQREITKDMFSEMEVIGQFNLGFIIARLYSDLFIVDQHATDEKYNFEVLQKTTTINSQSLVVPQKLDLTAMNECILIENLEVFQKNGFGFIIDDSAPAGTKVKLTSVPISKNWVFGKEDVDELIFMLQDSPHTLCRPSRVRAMFASRACRKSVMIGTALSHQVMQKLIRHMGEIEQPWNCPHGRPTMRHLVNLNLLT